MLSPTHLQVIPSSKSGVSPTLSVMLWISGQSYRVSLRAVRDERTSCSISVQVTPGLTLLARVCSTNPLTASAKAPPLRSAISWTRLLSLRCGDTSPPRAWPTAERRFFILSARWKRGEGRDGEGLKAGSDSSSILLTDSESSSKPGGRSREEGSDEFSHILSSIQDTRCGDWGRGLWMESTLALFMGSSLLAPLALRSTTPPGVAGESGFFSNDPLRRNKDINLHNTNWDLPFYQQILMQYINITCWLLEINVLILN